MKEDIIMDFKLFEEVYAIVSEYIYKLIEILFGITRDENGNLVK
jgi:hypothetical protein